MTLTFPAGLIGFPQAQRFVLVEWGGDDSPFRLLRSLDDEGLAFVVVPPDLFFPDYEPELEVGEHDVVLVIVTVPDRVQDATANLLGPLVIDVTAGNFFEGRAVVFVSVLEPSPDAANDCPTGADDNVLIGSGSPTIDAGFPTSVFGNEPQPNGGRINLGHTGNTPQATTSVCLSSPRSARSVMRAVYAWSQRSRKPSRRDSKPLTCVSHQRRSTVTSRTPASTSRRARSIRCSHDGQPQRSDALGSITGRYFCQSACTCAFRIARWNSSARWPWTRSTEAAPPRHRGSGS